MTELGRYRTLKIEAKRLMMAGDMVRYMKALRLLNVLRTQQPLRLS